jgi:hypothetical protein
MITLSLSITISFSRVGLKKTQLNYVCNQFAWHYECIIWLSSAKPWWGFVIGYGTFHNLIKKALSNTRELWQLLSRWCWKCSSVCVCVCVCMCLTLVKCYLILLSDFIKSLIFTIRNHRKATGESTKKTISKIRSGSDLIYYQVRLISPP